jgi:hypothetical protein
MGRGVVRCRASESREHTGDVGGTGVGAAMEQNQRAPTYSPTGRPQPNIPVERTAHSAGFWAVPGSVPVGRRLPEALGCMRTIFGPQKGSHRALSGWAQFPYEHPRSRWVIPRATARYPQRGEM